MKPQPKLNDFNQWELKLPNGQIVTSTHPGPLVRFYEQQMNGR